MNLTDQCWQQAISAAGSAKHHIEHGRSHSHEARRHANEGDPTELRRSREAAFRAIGEACAHLETARSLAELALLEAPYEAVCKTEASQ